MNSFLTLQDLRNCNPIKIQVCEKIYKSWMGGAGGGGGGGRC